MASSRSKKSRKVGLIGVRKNPDYKRPVKSESTTSRGNKHKGKPAGNRNNIEPSTQKQGNSNQKLDPRVGSKKPIQLVKEETPKSTVQKKRYSTPAQELAALESDERLALLLDKLDDGKPISKMEQAYVDEKTARHAVLCDLLGIDLEEDDADDDEDPLERLDAFKLDAFKLDDFKD